MITISKEILNGLVSNTTYVRKVLPYINEEYFDYTPEKVIFGIIKSHIERYGSMPNEHSLLLELNESKLSQTIYNQSYELASEIFSYEKILDKDVDFLCEKTERFCKNQAIHNALIKSTEVYDALQNDKADVVSSEIPELFRQAISVSFNDSIGHDYFSEAEDRFAYYQNVEVKIPFNVEVLNEVTNGGVSKKTLNIIMAGTNVGKTMIMCDFAAANLLHGKNVLYITLEMSELEISKRIDANLLGVPINELKNLSKDSFLHNINRLKQRTLGKLVVKEYPTGGASIAHFTKLVEELKLKKNFVPDVVYIDYINICASSKGKLAGIVGSYGYMKTVAEEIRGFMVKHEFCGWSATQANREGNITSDPNVSNSSESMGIPNVSDFFLAVVTNEELAFENKLLCKQLKSRYNNKTIKQKFFVKVDYSLMKIYDDDGYVNSQKVFESDDMLETQPVYDSQPNIPRRVGISNNDLIKINNGR